ncbi:methyl-accepting chemotaxis protein [Dethiobacter alkaliphilus]|uniref:methyl-accepting chemotaxis protein n=1 Tax=Dethiobacter alkaliphilus TaxID=427926 RepID=UPI002226666E|nr:methyl-accepting chemotaxis protein [Dethiobacter alkaliphilus]MCW3489111.1 methyl-accepting chemotaxis protein [Dethiobacter alkaliphilus]
MKIGIRLKIALSTIILVVLSVTILGISSYIITANNLEEMRIEEFTNVVSELQQNLHLNIDNTEQLIRFMAATPAIQVYVEEEDVALAPDLLAEAGRIYDSIETLLLTDANGVVVASSDRGGSVGLDLSGRDYYQEARGGQVAVSDVITSQVTGNTAFTVAVPLQQSNALSGMLVAVLNFDQVVGNYVQGVTVGETGYAWMVDRTGLVLSHPNQDHVLSTNLAENENPELAATVQRMGQGESGYSLYEFEGRQRLTVYEPVANWALAFAMDVDEYMGPAYVIRNSIVLVALIFIVLGILISIFIGRQIGNPVVQMMQAMKQAESGDLTVNVDVKNKDEIGQLSDSFNNMIAGQREIVGKLLESAASVSAASQELSASVEESNASMQEISSTVESEVAAKAQDIALASDQAAESGRNTRTVADQGADAVEEAGQAMKEIDSSAKEVSAVIQELDEASKQIGMIINTIGDIAEQTNLLALNAAIEAARAGEQGRGFAVVAEEVRKLAEGSSKAAGEIGDLIMNIQGKTGNAVEKMSAAGVIVDRGAELAESAQQFLVDIRQAVGQVGGLIDQMAAAAQEQSASAEEISASTQEQTGVLEEISATTDQLASMAEDLNALVSHFKI